MASTNQNLQVTPVPLATRLQSARERLRLTQAEVAEATSIGESSLSEFENGRREPSIAQLQKLAQHYRRSLSWLLGEEGDASEVVLWRARPEPQVSAAIEARFIELCARYQHLETWCRDVARCDLPAAHTKPAAEFRYNDAEALARRVRGELALGDRPGESLLRTLEEACGVKVFHLDFEPSGTAACTRSDAFGSAILLNKQNVAWRRSFDLAHELFHLLTWDLFRGGWSGTPPVATEKEEKLANAFASSLLMPEEVFKLAARQRMQSDTALSNLDQAFSLAREFGVSVEAVLIRAKVVLDLGESETSQLRNQWKAVSAFYEDRKSDDPPELPNRFHALALAALQGGELSIGRFAEYTGVSRQKALNVARRQESLPAETDQASTP